MSVLYKCRCTIMSQVPHVVHSLPSKYGVPHLYIGPRF